METRLKFDQNLSKLPWLTLPVAYSEPKDDRKK